MFDKKTLYFSSYDKNLYFYCLVFCGIISKSFPLKMRVDIYPGSIYKLKN